MQMYGKKIIAKYDKYLDNEQFQVVVVYDPEICSDGETYYNIHVISEKYKNNEMNTLKLQEPKSVVTDEKEFFNKNVLISHLMDHFIWDRFYNEGIFSGYVKIEFDKHI